MDVQACGLCTFMPSEQCDIVETDPCTLEDGATLMPQGMRSQCGKANLLSNPLDDLIKGSDSGVITFFRSIFPAKAPPSTK